ncbi:hypothetical protein [Clostridium magnum]|uniref:Uncharacterized protein n=1 Tax=Clostridium magnum DSM 2767 TaxID=1121326 RepID=A0A161YQ79_9CLOT|nr:hypothetical protein [Clostridium magnum]KZL92992.1 hypothetical protein CLMAG_28060 [Clostridium magnum DSM 2767]SHJ22687.1 hypothetical protein SAMN02745944_05575 [Clostridium magnum DSM 2767]
MYDKVALISVITGELVTIFLGIALVPIVNASKFSTKTKCVLPSCVLLGVSELVLYFLYLFK